ncbi:UDP-glucuronic acid decarboxylase family protein [Streptomyces sp. NPDC006552]|uniref:UDP-glucuronic acid decarboxylase family protein n=1 Tax=Streptomyces sp. NPDC006552 TaxID=3157179 RepID=UPI0033B0EBDD
MSEETNCRSDLSQVSRQRVLIAGGAGFLGSHLSEKFINLGAEVICLDNLSTGRRENISEIMDNPRFTFIEADVTSGKVLEIDGRLDAVFHLASPASPIDYQNIPIETLLAGSVGTRNLLEVATEKDSRFVLASTSEVYGEPLEHPQRETYFGNVDSTGPRSSYDEAKRYAEALTTAYRQDRGTDTAIVRIFNTYGPRMRENDGRVVPAFIGQAIRGVPLTVAGDGEQTRAFCYVDDLIEGIVALASSSEYAGPVNLGNPQEMTMLELAHLVIDVTGSASGIDFIPRPEGDPSRRKPDISLAARELNWSPQVSPGTGLKQTASWFARNLSEPRTRYTVVGDTRSRAKL